MGFVSFPTGIFGSTPQLSGPGLAFVRSVTFTDAATVSLDNVFTANYENYRVTVTAVNSGATACRLRMRLASSDDTSANYATQYTQAANTTNAAARESAQTSGFIFQPLNVGAAASIDIYRPAVAVATRALSVVNYGTTSVEVLTHAVVHNVATAYDGFTIYPASGTTTGILTVYGYRKA